jgi:hypothetical protein
MRNDLLILLLTGSLLAAAPVAGAEQADEKVAAEQEPIEYGEGGELCELANEAINESSGLACSRMAAEVFWTHNDSGDSARIFAFNMKGEDLGECTIEDASARDWEDMASWTIGRRGHLLLADVGDNSRNRKSCVLYDVLEPPLNRRRQIVAPRAEVRRKIVFVYEDGPRDCEAVAVDPVGKTIYLISKEPLSKVYALPWPKPDAKMPVSARTIATLKVPGATGMDISPDGLRAVVLTYAHAFEYTRKPDEKWADAFARKPRPIKMPPRRQGESVCYGPDGKTIYLTSEGVPTPLLEVPVIEPE